MKELGAAPQICSERLLNLQERGSCRMLRKMFELGKLVKDLIVKIPYLEGIGLVRTSTFTYVMLGVFAAIIALVCVLFVRAISKTVRYGFVKKFFGISDLSGFKLKRMGKVGSKYYVEEGVNEFRLGIPHQKKNSKIVKENSILWLIAGRKTYVLITKDPFAMIHLVHQLRNAGLDISPCDQELEKQQRIQESLKSTDEIISDAIQNAANDEEFVSLCRQRLTIHGFTVSDAPKNNDGIRLFINRRGQPTMIKCLLVERNVLISTEEVEVFRDALQKFFVEAGILITTGKVSVAAVSLAKANNIEIIFNEKLVDLLRESKEISTSSQYLRWELTSEDINEMMPKGAIEKIF